MSQFDFLKGYNYFNAITTVCEEAEASIAVSNATCALQARRSWRIHLMR